MKYLLIMSLLVLAGCQKPPEQSTHTGEFKVEKLFTHEGCTAYRFYDDRTVYYVNCQGQSQTQSQHSCGKNCTTNQIVTTEIVK